MARCAICGTDRGVRFCSFCGEHLCGRCEKNYPKRAVAATRKAVRKAGDLVSRLKWQPK